MQSYLCNVDTFVIVCSVNDKGFQGGIPLQNLIKSDKNRYDYWVGKHTPREIHKNLLDNFR